MNDINKLVEVRISDCYTMEHRQSMKTLLKNLKCATLLSEDLDKESGDLVYSMLVNESGEKILHALTLADCLDFKTID